MIDQATLRTFPVLGGTELEYLTPYGGRIAVVVFSDGGMDITYTGDATVSLPVGATSILRDLILNVIPLPKMEPEMFADLIDEYGSARVQLDAAMSTDIARERNTYVASLFQQIMDQFNAR